MTVLLSTGSATGRLPSGSTPLLIFHRSSGQVRSSSAEDYHQQYLYKVPNGYCPDHSTSVSCPVGLIKADAPAGFRAGRLRPRRFDTGPSAAHEAAIREWGALLELKASAGESDGQKRAA